MSDFDYPNTHLEGFVSRRTPATPVERAELVRGLSRRVHGTFASRKNNASMTLRTHEEFDLLRLIEVDQNVLSYETLPERVSFREEGKDRSHYPAVRIETRRGHAILDAFPSKIGKGRTRLIAIMKEIYADRGISYRAFRGHELCLRPRMDNARHILAHRGLMLDPATEFAITAIVGEREGLTLAELEMELGGRPGIAGMACAIALDRSLALDLSATKPMAMRISFPSRTALR